MIDRILPGFAALDLRGGGARDKRRQEHGREGATKLFAAVADTPVKVFGTFTGELRALCAWLQQHQVKSVAMEATGVYGIPVHDRLQADGFAVTLFHGAPARNLPGRPKSDISDPQWHAMLHSHGLLRPCFIPAEPICKLRSFHRLRADHLWMAAAHIAHMQRALDLMNVRLHHVLSQLHGVSGLRVLEAILAGQRDPAVLAALCEAQVLKKKKAERLASLEGDWQEHHLCARRQALEAYRFYQAQIAACDAQIEALRRALNAERTPQAPPPGQKVKIVRHNAPVIANLRGGGRDKRGKVDGRAHGELLTLCGGRDATLLPGFSPLSWMKLVAEVGPDLSAFADEPHFAAWAALSPQRHQSGRRQRRRPRPKTAVGQIFREAAMSLAKSKYLALGGFYRRLKGRRGAAGAIVATARKLAVLFYRAMTRGLDYVERGLDQYEAACRAQSERHLRKMAARLGFTLQPKNA